MNIRTTTTSTLMVVSRVNLDSWFTPLSYILGNEDVTGSLSFFLHLIWKRIFTDKLHGFLWTRCPSCYQTNSVKALKETQTLTPTMGNHPQVSSFLPSPPDPWPCVGPVAISKCTSK